MRRRQGRTHHIGRWILLPSWSDSRLRSDLGATDVAIPFFVGPDIDRTIFFVGNGTGTRQEGAIMGKRGRRLRQCWCSLAVRRKRLVKLLRISPSVLATLISSSTILLRLSLRSDGAPSPLSSTYSLSAMIRSVHSFLSRVFSLSIHLTHILSVSLSRPLSIPHHHTIRSKFHTILALY